MKILVWILLLVNVIFFAVMQWGGALSGEAQPVQAQPALHEEKIRLLDVPSVSGMSGSQPLPASTAAISSALPKPNKTIRSAWNGANSPELILLARTPC